MKITIIGHGYVGLVTATVFAELGNSVYVIGRNHEKIQRLQNGDPILYEPGLEELLKRNLKANRIQFTLSYTEGIPNSDIVFICVGTPPKENGEADLSNVLKVAKEIGNHIRKYIVVSCKSTVPVGTNRKIKDIIMNECGIPPSKFDIASCPEFLREGTGVSDTFHPDRIVIGTESKKAEKILLDFHKPISGERVITTLESAEMIKYASNSLLATKISFANIIAFLCEAVGADAEAVLQGVGLDRRLGRHFLYPGAGYGGSCLPKDVKALIKIGEKYHVDMSLLAVVEKINRMASENIVSKAHKSLSTESDKTVCILGLSFKPDTDDIRDAPSIRIINSLLLNYKNLKLRLYDPIVKSLPGKYNDRVVYCENSYSAAEGSDAVIILTEWNEFRKLDLSELKKRMKGNALIDGRNIYDPEECRKIGFKYIGVGRSLENTSL